MPEPIESSAPSVSRTVAAPASAVWAVLSDGWTYATWVVGTSRVRAVDESWPAAGSKIHHSVGVWPALLSDHTSVDSVEADRRLVLTARGWPLGEAQVALDITPLGPDRCQVTMTEDAAAGPGRLVPKPLREVAIRPRNAESLTRLALLAEGRAGGPASRSG